MMDNQINIKFNTLALPDKVTKNYIDTLICVILNKMNSAESQNLNGELLPTR